MPLVLTKSPMEKPAPLENRKYHRRTILTHLDTLDVVCLGFLITNHAKSLAPKLPQGLEWPFTATLIPPPVFSLPNVWNSIYFFGHCKKIYVEKKKKNKFLIIAISLEDLFSLISIQLLNYIHSQLLKCSTARGSSTGLFLVNPTMVKA